MSVWYSLSISINDKGMCVGNGVDVCTHTLRSRTA